MGEVVDILAIFPLCHALVVVLSAITGTDTMRVANEERANFLRDAEVDHLSSGFVAQVTHAPL